MMSSCTLKALRAWMNRLEEKPGVYLIQCIENGAIYVGSAEKSLRQRLSQHLTDLLTRDHPVPLLQEDWTHLGAERFLWCAQYAATARDAWQEEMWLIRLAQSLEDQGGYNRRAPRNCVSVSVRASENYFLNRKKRKYCLLPSVQFDDRIHPVMIRTFCQGDLPLVREKDFSLGLGEGERLGQMAGWRAAAIRFHPEEGQGA